MRFPKETFTHSITFTPTALTLTRDGDNFTGSTTVDNDKMSSKEEQQAAILLYRKVKRAVGKGKDATVKRKKNGELCVYEVDMRVAE